MASKANTAPKFELKGLKSFMGTDSLAFTATLYLGGKKVAAVSDGGHGGCHDYHWFDPSAERALAAYASSLPAEKYHNLVLQPDSDTVIDRLITQIEDAKWFKRQCRNKTLFRVEGDEPGKWRTVAHPFSPNVADFIRKKYPAVEEIANETRLD